MVMEHNPNNKFFALGNQTLLNTIWKFRMCYSKNYTQMRARRLILVLLVKKKKEDIFYLKGTIQSLDII